MGKLDAPDRDLIAVYSANDDGTLIPEPVAAATVQDAARAIALDVLWHGRPVFVVRFNPVERWSEDISTEVAQAVVEYARSEGLSLSEDAFDFAEDHGAAMPMWAAGIEYGRFVDYAPEMA